MVFAQDLCSGMVSKTLPFRETIIQVTGLWGRAVPNRYRGVQSIRGPQEVLEVCSSVALGLPRMDLVGRSQTCQ